MAISCSNGLEDQEIMVGLATIFARFCVLSPAGMDVRRFGSICFSSAWDILMTKAWTSPWKTFSLHGVIQEHWDLDLGSLSIERCMQDLVSGQKSGFSFGHGMAWIWFS